MLSQSTGTIGSACGHMRDCFMKMRRSSTTGSDFTGFALLTMMTKRDDLRGRVPRPHQNDQQPPPGVSTRHVRYQKKNTAAVANPLNGLLALAFRVNEIALQRLRPVELALQRNLRIRPIVQPADVAPLGRAGCAGSRAAPAR